MRIDAGLGICLALILGVMGAGAAAAEPQIVWQVENPFRFFLDPADTQVHRATWQSLSEAERAHPVQSAERALSAAIDLSKNLLIFWVLVEFLHRQTTYKAACVALVLVAGVADAGAAIQHHTRSICSRPNRP